MAQQVKSPTSVHEDAASIPGLSQWLKDLALRQAEVFVLFCFVLFLFFIFNLKKIFFITQMNLSHL